MSSRTTTAAVILGLAATLGLGGCYGPGGPLLNYTGAPQTYASTTYRPATVVLVDTRTNEPVFELDIPVGQQLTIRFLEDEGDDEIETPALMKYAIQARGTRTGKLTSSLTVPAAGDRRVDVSYRQGPEYGSPDPNAMGRVDRPGDRPAWWTAGGGPVPDGYDGSRNDEG